MLLSVFVSAFFGGVVRGLVGFIKHQFSYKNVSFKFNYFIGMALLSGFVGMVSAIAIKELGFTLFNSFTPALSFVIGYSGGDFIENIYKVIIKKSNLYDN